MAIKNVKLIKFHGLDEKGGCKLLNASKGDIVSQILILSNAKEDKLLSKSSALLTDLSNKNFFENVISIDGEIQQLVDGDVANPSFGFWSFLALILTPED